MIISRLNVFFCLLLFLSISKVQAQFLKTLKNKIQSKIENNINSKAEKKIDRAFEKDYKIKDKNISKKSKSLPNTSYHFNTGLTISMNSNSSKDAVTIEVYFSEKHADVICMSLAENEKMKNQKIYSIISPTETITLMNSGGMKIRMDELQSMVPKMTQQEIPEDIKIHKTGKTKNILGYSCQEHQYQEEKNHSTTFVYATKESVPVSSKYIPMLGMQSKNNMDGFVMRIENITGKHSTSIEVIKFLENINLTLKPSEYKAMF